MTTASIATARGATDIAVTALARILYGCSLAAVLAGAGHGWGSGSLPWVIIIPGILVAGLCAGAEIYLGQRANLREERQVRRTLLSATLASERVVAEDQAEKGNARALALMTGLLERYTKYRQEYIGPTIAAFTIPVLVLGWVAFAIDWVTAAALLAAFALVPLLITGFMKVFSKVSSGSRQERERLTVSYLDALRQLTPIALYGAGSRIDKELAEVGEANRRALMKLLAGNQVVIIVMDGLGSLLLLAWSAFVVTSRVEAGVIEPAEALSVVFLLVLLLEPMAQVAAFFYIGMAGRAGQKALTGYLRAQSRSGTRPGHPGGHPGGRQHPHGAGPSSLRAVTDRTHPGGRPGGGHASHWSRNKRHSDSDVQTPAEQEGATVVVIPADPSAAVSASGVAYDYGRGKVFAGVNLSVYGGEKIVLTGPSGSGKSTLLALLHGKITATSGQVIVGGLDLAACSPAERRTRSAVIAQHTWLFTGTVADNLRLAKPDATEDEMWEALERAYLTEEVRAMAGGLGADVGEKGSLLSGGQAQRLSLARALLSGRSIIIADEPTSHVDARSEDMMIRALTNLESDTTLIMSTHRPALVAAADRVLRLDGGSLREVGP